MPKLAPGTQQARREHILDAAERCFISKGFHHATMNDICREGGISPGALYTYFVSKEELIGGLCERETERFSKELGKMMEPGDLLGALHRMTEQYCCNEPAEKVRLHVEIGAEAGRNALVANLIRETDKVISKSLVELLERERERGRIAPKLPLEIVVQTMMAFGDGLFMRRSFDQEFQPKSIIPAMMAMIEALLQAVPLENGGGNNEKAH